MIIKSHIKQKNKSFLILIQLFFSSFCLSFGLGLLELNIAHIRDVNSLLQSNTLYTYINLDGSVVNRSTEEINSIKGFFNDLKNDDRVSNIGSYDVGYIESNSLPNKPDSVYDDVKVILVDNSLLNILVNSQQLGLTNSYEDSTFPLVVGDNLKNILPIGTQKNIKVNSNNKEYHTTVKNFIKNGTYFLPDSFGANISHKISSTEDMVILALPPHEEPLYREGIFIQLKPNSNEEQFKKDISDLSIKYGIGTYTHTIANELSEYIDRNKIPMVVSFFISLILLFLSSIGLIGVILSSIIRRKSEFGIRYSLGCTPINLLKLVVGEILMLFTVGTFLGITFSFIISLFIEEMKIGIISISISAIIMFIFCFLSSIIPAINIIKIEPIKLINIGSD